MGEPQYQPVSIEQYELPKSNARRWLGAIAALVILGLAVAAFLTSRRPTPELPMAPSAPISAPSSRQVPTAAASGNSVPFHSPMDNADGVWSIDSTRWTDRGLEVTVTIKVTRGTLRYSFFALDNKTVEDYDPIPISDHNALTQGTVHEGEKITGLVVFEKDRGDTTVYLANALGRQISALTAQG